LKTIAVLYDIENLVGGYNLKYLSEISLKNILSELNNLGLSQIAIQKAYADWSNFKLNELKWDIAELGIEPIQMYGFSKGNMKNASDIQLVIDAMEILHTKRFIDTFVIISGDGGFSSLVKKISEYGKKVIGCSYKNTANKIFTQICDDFIYIDNTLTKEQLSVLKQVKLDDNKKKQIIENPILKEVLPSFEILYKYNLDDIENIVSKFMDSLFSKFSAKRILQKNGLNISVFKSALNYILADFEHKQFGFARLSDFVRYILRNTNFKLMLKEPSDYRILHKSCSLKLFSDVEPLLIRPKIHCTENYINYLSSKKPLIFIPENMCNFYKIIKYLLLNKDNFRNKLYEDIILELIYLNIEEKEMHKLLSLLINTDILKGDNSSIIVKEQSYYFSPLNIDEILNNIYKKIREKLLLSIDGTINEDELNNIFIRFEVEC
jgi:uncharacterized LabA/DUF88 family protein